FSTVVAATSGLSVKLPPLTAVKVAVTDVAAFTVTTQFPVPEQPLPLQPANVEPAAGAALRVTTVPVVKEVEQVAPHEIPAGELVTMPSAVMLRFVLATPLEVGVNLTVTVAVAPLPARVKGLPETILKGAGTEAAPLIVPGRVF